ncbi:MAG: hypothetical protein ACRDZM_00725 [Acidimicrobiia bacterium]
MGQQPNIELTESDLPRRDPATPPARSWRAERLGVPTSPGEVPRGGMFGQPAPDGGWAMRIIGAAKLPDDDPNLELVLGALMVARAAALGRGPTLEDLEVALTLCGYGHDAKPEVIARRDRWIEAVSHEIRPGETAVAEVDVDLIVNKPEQVRWALSHSGDDTKHDPS